LNAISRVIIPQDESKRIEAVRRYDILDTPPDGAFDRITALAARRFDVPISIISIVDHDRIWFKSHHGLTVKQIRRDPGLCASAILAEIPHVLTDAAIDPRSLANPLVAGDFGLRFMQAFRYGPTMGSTSGPFASSTKSQGRLIMDRLMT
jgi:GAF domain-containing protein